MRKKRIAVSHSERTVTELSGGVRWKKYEPILQAAAENSRASRRLPARPLARPTCLF